MTPESENKYGKTDDERNRPRYPISVVAEMFDVHPQTLRLYEREGLIKPKRTAKQTRMYSEADVEQLKSILSLTDIGVNLAGVEIIMRMSRQIEDERARFRAILQEIWERYQVDVRQWGEEQSTDLIPMSNRRVVRVQKETPQPVDTIEADED